MANPRIVYPLTNTYKADSLGLYWCKSRLESGYLNTNRSMKNGGSTVLWVGPNSQDPLECQIAAVLFREDACVDTTVEWDYCIRYRSTESPDWSDWYQITTGWSVDIPLEAKTTGSIEVPRDDGKYVKLSISGMLFALYYSELQSHFELSLCEVDILSQTRVLQDVYRYGIACPSYKESVSGKIYWGEELCCGPALVLTQEGNLYNFEEDDERISELEEVSGTSTLRNKFVAR